MFVTFSIHILFKRDYEIRYLIYLQNIVHIITQNL